MPHTSFSADLCYFFQNNSSRFPGGKNNDHFGNESKVRFRIHSTYYITTMQNVSNSYTYNQFESHYFKRTHPSRHTAIPMTKMIPQTIHTRHKQYSITLHYRSANPLFCHLPFHQEVLLFEIQSPQQLAYFTFKFNFRYFHDKSKWFLVYL